MESSIQKENVLRISEIGVQALFGVYNHTVKLNERERITIIHGPNGVGKTAFLRLTKSLLSGSYGELAKTPFSHFYVIFNDGGKAGIQKINSSDGTPSVSFYYESNNGQKFDTQVPLDNLDPSRLASRIENESPYLMRAGPEHWIDRRSEELLSASEVVIRFSDQLPKNIQKKLLKAVPELQKVLKSIKVHLIEAQRLIKIIAGERNWRFHGDDRSTIAETVHEYSNDLKERVAETLKAYGKESQRLDQSFPQRLISLTTSTKSIENLKEDLQKIEEQRKNLKRIGLIDDNEDRNHPFSISSLETIDETKLSVMTLYVEDSQKKLDTLRGLALRVEILLDNINGKFTHKSLSIHRDAGLIANGPDGKRLSLSSLSSGEQHEIVLLYDLLFKVETNTLVLIDEPELSLHVSWQKSFLDDLMKIIKIAQFDVLLATHSPFIVGDRSDLMVELATEQGRVRVPA